MGTEKDKSSGSLFTHSNSHVTHVIYRWCIFYTFNYAIVLLFNSKKKKNTIVYIYTSYQKYICYNKLYILYISKY